MAKAKPDAKPPKKPVKTAAKTTGKPVAKKAEPKAAAKKSERKPEAAPPKRNETSRASAGKAEAVKAPAKTESAHKQANVEAAKLTESKSAIAPPPQRPAAAPASRPELEKPKSPGAAATPTQSPAPASSAGAAAAPPTTPTDPEEISELEGVRLPNTRGKVGVFGGPRDHSAKPDDKLALPTGLHFQYERVHSLNGKSFYCAMRWDYRQKHMSPEEGKRWWANKRIMVTNPANGRSVIVRAVDYGPHENTGLAISISPGAAEALGVEVGGDVEIKFADQKAQLGPVHE
ncbi:MAG TPA: hypothetical protein VFV34_27535 [Blastocatellia bacterium]|nr:hypothetical protein [Blastocatellia bacterium]